MTTDRRCATWEDLTDWWVGDLAPVEADGVEEHLLSCEPCARRVERVADLARGIAALVMSGRMSGPVTPGVVARLERDGVRVHRYRIRPGEVVPCSVWPDDEVMAAVLDVGALVGDQAIRYDLVARAGDESPIRVDDVPLDPATGTLTWLSAAAAERQRPVTRVVFQLLRVSGEGESVAADYALAHEPWTGPASPR